MELGLLIKGGELPGRVVSHFRRLVENGTLVHVQVDDEAQPGLSIAAVRVDEADPVGVGDEAEGVDEPLVGLLRKPVDRASPRRW